MDCVLHQKQSVAFLSKATEILYGGAAGGGKSHLMRVAAISWCGQIPGLQVYLFRKTFPDLKKNHMEGATSFPELLAEFLKSGHVRYNQQDSVYKFWNGSRIHLCHLQYDKDVTKYQGAEIHVLMMDELTHFSVAAYRYLRGRCRMIGIKLPKAFDGQFPRILAGSNPGGVGHNWVKHDFVDIAPAMEITRMPKKEGGMLRQYIPARVEDNPSLLKDDPEYLDRLDGLGNPALVRAMREGDWDIVAGGMLDDVWDRDRHEVAPFEIPKSWRMDRGFDWGSSKPYATCWFAEADGSPVQRRDGSEWHPQRGSVFIIGELYGWNGRPNEGCKDLATNVARKIRQIDRNTYGGRVEPGPADNAIFDTQNGNCIADDMAQNGIRWERSDKSPGSRINGWEKLREYLSNAVKGEGPGLYVFDTCRHTIRTIPTLPRDDRKPDDVDTDSEDHIADVVRYRLTMPRLSMQRGKLGGL